MKLLFDQNLSHRLLGSLAGLYPGSVHVRDVQLSEADDTTVWEYCKDNGYIVVSEGFGFSSTRILAWPATQGGMAASGELHDG